MDLVESFDLHVHDGAPGYDVTYLASQGRPAEFHAVVVTILNMCNPSSDIYCVEKKQKQNIVYILAGPIPNIKWESQKEIKMILYSLPVLSCFLVLFERYVLCKICAIGGAEIVEAGHNISGSAGLTRSTCSQF